MQVSPDCSRGKKFFEVKILIDKISFASDYLEGAHPKILDRLIQTNFFKSVGYGLDEFSESARKKIREACDCPDAEIYFLTGGTQTNAVVIDAVLKSYQGVIAADSGHISIHEAGAIEFCGHKVLTLPNHYGKISAEQIKNFVETFNNDQNHDHMVAPGMVYISQPTEYGTLYTLNELKTIKKICIENNLILYIDGARLAYALACPLNDISLKDVAKLCDVFYIGGTKCGALIGEAVVIPKKNFIPHFFTIMKQHGALLAKGRLLGIQFDELFTDNLYFEIGKSAIKAAYKICNALEKFNYKIAFHSPTNQIFVILNNEVMKNLAEKVEFSFWEKFDEDHTVVRFATSWATNSDDVDKLIDILSQT